MRNTEKAACGHLLVNVSRYYRYLISANCTLTVFIAAFFFGSHEPRPRGEPDPCAAAFPTLPHHPVSRSGSVGSVHTRDPSSCRPGVTTTAAAQLEGEGANGERS